MKKTILLLTALIFISNFIYSQSLKKNEIDEFTGNIVRETTWELLDGSGTHLQQRLRYINNRTLIFEIKYLTSGVTSINKGDLLMLKLFNGKIINLDCIEYVISCYGCGATGHVGSAALGIYASYFVNIENFEELITAAVTKIRINTTDGYVNIAIKEKNAMKLQKSFTIIK